MPTAEFGQGAKRRRPAGVKTAQRLFLSTPLRATEPKAFSPSSYYLSHHLPSHHKTKEDIRLYPLPKCTKSQPGLEPIRGSQTMPTAEFGQGAKRRRPAGVKTAQRLFLSTPLRATEPKAFSPSSYYLLHQPLSHHKTPIAFISTTPTTIPSI